jgi:hypothetical protein
VNLSAPKLGIYDFLGLIVPGMILLSEGWITSRGWVGFIRGTTDVRPLSFTLFLVAAFVVGHFIQELADWAIKKARGERYLLQGRDSVWKSDEGDAIKSAIWTDSGITLGGVDAAFDYCLSRVGASFSKRDVFLGTSDFARASLVLTAAGIGPAVRLALDRTRHLPAFVLFLVIYLLVLSLLACLGWRRMVRFRRMSETAVFRAYLAARAGPKNGEREPASSG